MCSIGKCNTESSSSDDRLDPHFVGAFHYMILTGREEDVKTHLSSTPALATSKDDMGLTPLMTSVMSDTPKSWKAQVQIINYLMEKGASSLAARNSSGYHVLLQACKHGVAPEVIDCLLGWSEKYGGVFRWDDSNSDKDTALVLAARSGSLELMMHLLTFEDLDLESSSSQSNYNAPIRIIDAAIQSGNEQLVLFLLGNGRIKDNIYDIKYDVEIHHTHFCDDFNVGTTSVSISVSIESCTKAAYESKMFQVIEKMAEIGMDISQTVWLCWRKSLDANSNIADIVIEDFAAAPRKIDAIAKDGKINTLFKCNPNLLPLLVARFRHHANNNNNNNDATTMSSNKNCCTTRNLHCTIIQLPDEIFQLIAQFCFVLDPDTLQKEVEKEQCYLKIAKWRCECEAWFLRRECGCCIHG